MLTSVKRIVDMTLSSVSVLLVASAEEIIATMMNNAHQGWKGNYNNNICIVQYDIGVNQLRRPIQRKNANTTMVECIMCVINNGHVMEKNKE